MQRYNLLDTNRVKVMSCDRLDVLALAAYKFSGPKQKWADMVKSARYYSTATILADLKIHSWIIVDTQMKAADMEIKRNRQKELIEEKVEILTKQIERSFEQLAEFTKQLETF